MTTPRNRRVAVLLAGLIGAGVAFVGPVAPAGADIDDLTTCVDVDIDGQPNCDHPDDPFDGPDDLTNPTPEPDPEPDPQPEPEADDELPPADVDGTVVADPTFTG